MIFAFNPPPILELGNATGFDFELEDRGGLGHEQLMQARDQLLGLARAEPEAGGGAANGLDDKPQFKIDIDREKASALGLSLADVNTTLLDRLGLAATSTTSSTDGRVKRVYVQADAPFRMKPDDLDRWYVRNANGEMVPFSAFATSRWTYGSPQLERYNGVSSIEIQGQAGAGHQHGQAMAAMEELARSCRPASATSGRPVATGTAVRLAGAAAVRASRSWSCSCASRRCTRAGRSRSSVILVVPLGVLGACSRRICAGLPNDVYFQVGLLTTIGLSAKNAILIVEFAKDLHERGHEPASRRRIEAARLRLRPILMTSLAFVLGVLPLAIAPAPARAARTRSAPA